MAKADEEEDEDKPKRLRDIYKKTAANAPKSKPKPPLSPRMEEIRKRIERGEMKVDQAPYLAPDDKETGG